jgi:hypothetical protein
MKPLNLDNKPCSPVSSNCIVWQGPDITCIELCHGDTISDVVSNLATELCTILDQTNVSNYDLSCLGILNCGPEDFKALVQLLINKICELENVPAQQTSTSSGSCPDCVVTVASCFVEDGATTMQLLDYVNMIAAKVCATINEINEIRNEISALDVRVTALEGAEIPGFTLPSILTDCTLKDGVIVAGNAYLIDEILDALVNDDTYGYCSLLGATGTPGEILSSVASQCIANEQSTLSKEGISYAVEYLGTWVDSPITAADTITNLWVVLCDMYGWASTLNPTITIEDEGVALIQRNTIDFVGAGVTASDDGVSKTIVDIPSGCDTFIARMIVSSSWEPEIFPGGTPSQIPSLAGGPPDGYADSPVPYRFNEVSFNSNIVQATLGAGSYVANVDMPAMTFGSFNNEDGTGAIFTVSQEGVYEISACCHLKADSPGTGYWQTTGSGSFGLGIIATGTNLYGGNSIPVIENLTKHVNASYSRVLYLPRFSELRLAIQNLTDRTYDGSTYTGSDFITWAITKLK